MKEGVPDDLNILVKIPAEDISSGRHSMAKCADFGCRNPVRWRMVIEEYPEGEGYYNTDYWCDLHKPQCPTPS